ncbi:MAG: flagellin [Verrucomicrobia bacterium]|nr:flagellin [Verrucomicrobiota bacterium]
MSDLARINTNVSALRAYLTVSEISDQILKASERISTGLKINRASDSPSGYYVKRLFEQDIASKQRFNENLERGVNWLQTNDSKLSNVVDMLIQMTDLTSQAKAGGVTSAERVGLQLQLNQLRAEIEDVLQSGVSPTLYSGFSLGNLDNVSLTGAALPSMADLSIEATDIDVTGSPSSSTVTGKIQTTLDNLSSAITRLVQDQEQIGSWIMRLDFEKQVSDTELVNLQASLSTIADADVAQEQMAVTKYQILQQTALAMLTQANTAPYSILSLFGG